MLGRTSVKYAFDNVGGLREELARLGVNEKVMYVLLHVLGTRNRTTAKLLLMQLWIEMTCLFAADLLQVMLHLAETGECGPEIRLRIAELSRLSLATARIDCILAELALMAAGKNQRLLDAARVKFEVHQTTTFQSLLKALAISALYLSNFEHELAFIYCCSILFWGAWTWSPDPASCQQTSTSCCVPNSA